MASESGDFFPNPYGQTSPYHHGTPQALFPSQMPQRPRHFRPRGQASTPYRSPPEQNRPQWQGRFKSPSPMHGARYGGQSPRGDGQAMRYGGHSPRGDGQAMRYGGPGYSPRGKGQNSNFGYNGSPAFRGSPGNFNTSPSHFPSPRYHSPKWGHRKGAYNKNADANPGGSDDISQYYCPSMVENPWEGLTPTPLREQSKFTT